MIRKVATILATFVFASAILFVSVLRSAAVRYAFNQPPSSDQNGEIEEIEINYPLPYPGRFLPDHFLWPVKVIRDKAWLLVTTNPLKKAEILLLFADKRLVSAQTLFERDKSELAVATLTKSAKYLEQAVKQEQSARKQGVETGQFLERLSLSTLKHRQVLEGFLCSCPEDAKPVVVQTMDYPKRLYEETKTGLIEIGRPFPESPFED